MDEDWKRSGKCRAIGVQEFFDLGDDATRTCAGCPVLADCRGYADHFRIEEGVWGAETERERRQRWRREARQRQKVNRSREASLRNVQRTVAEHVCSTIGPWYTTELAAALRHDPDDIDVVLNTLATNGIVEPDGPGRWCSP